MSNEPIVFWGPGSEWFWIMLQTLVVTVTLVGIYYQFRLQRAANAFEQLNRISETWESESMLRARLQVARAIVAGEEVPEGGLSLIGNYWETVATLVREGHVNERVVAGSLGGGGALWWTAIADATRKLRKDRDDPSIFANFEWLAARFSADGARAGAATAYDLPALAQIYAAAIPGLLDRIQVAEDSRMVPEPRPSRARRSGPSEQR